MLLCSSRRPWAGGPTWAPQTEKPPALQHTTHKQGSRLQPLPSSPSSWLPLASSAVGSHGAPGSAPENTQVRCPRRPTSCGRDGRCRDPPGSTPAGSRVDPALAATEVTPLLSLSLASMAPAGEDHLLAQGEPRLLVQRIQAREAGKGASVMPAVVASAARLVSCRVKWPAGPKNSLPPGIVSTNEAPW